MGVDYNEKVDGLAKKAAELKLPNARGIITLAYVKSKLKGLVKSNRRKRLQNLILQMIRKA